MLPIPRFIVLSPLSSSPWRWRCSSLYHPRTFISSTTSSSSSSFSLARTWTRHPVRFFPTTLHRHRRRYRPFPSWFTWAFLPTLPFTLWYFDPSETHQQPFQGTLRSLRTLACVSVIMAHYKKMFWKFGYLGTDSEIYIQERAKVHQQSADLLLELCRTHGGIYIKAAQHLASLVRIVPKEYTDTLSVLQDKAPFRPFEEIANVIVHELGAHPSELFSEFDETPLAAASLAQVHRAVTHQGEECAVKVQYPEVVHNFYTDISCMQTLCKFVSKVFPEFDLGWIVHEFESNLLREFDFQLEAHNSETTAEKFRHHRHFHVPKVYWPLTTKKILTMEYIRGTKINCFDELRRQGLQTHQIAQTLIDVFAEMVFIHGFVHCDPHPGNFLVRPDPHHPHSSQLVLLDHGLYRTLDPHFRFLYAQLWVAILSNSSSLLAQVSRQLGLQAYTQLLPTLFAGFVPGTRTMYLGDDITEAHRLVLKDTLHHFAWTDAVSLLAGVERDMLFVMRTFTLVGAVHRGLGGTNAQKFRTLAWVSVKAGTRGWDRVRFGVRVLWYLWVLRGWRRFSYWMQGVVMGGGVPST